MAEYIEREATYEDFEKCNSENPKWTPGRVKALIARQKTANVALVRHGRWKISSDYGLSTCSACGWNIEEYVEDYAYCPVCGAKMEGDHDG